MKTTIRQWMPLAIYIALVAVPLVLFGLKWWWPPRSSGIHSHCQSRSRARNLNPGCPMGGRGL